MVLPLIAESLVQDKTPSFPFTPPYIPIYTFHHLALPPIHTSHHLPFTNTLLTPSLGDRPPAGGGTSRAGRDLCATGQHDGHRGVCKVM